MSRRSSRSGRGTSASSRRPWLCRSATTACRTRAGSPTASPCRRSRWRAASGSASSRLRERASRSQCSDACRTRSSPPRTLSTACTRWSKSSSTRPRVRALLCPASLKCVLSARDAAGALARGMRGSGAEAVELPVADGGEGTGEALQAALGGDWRTAIVSDPLGRAIPARWLLLPDGRAVVEAATAIGLPLLAPGERDPLRASSRGLGELVAAALEASPASLVVALGGSATVDGGAGLREVVRALPVDTVVLCDVRTHLADAARLFGPQKGASLDDVAVLERRLAEMAELLPFAHLPGSGAAVRCVVFGGRVGADISGAETIELSGDPTRAEEDLVELGRRLGG